MLYNQTIYRILFGSDPNFLFYDPNKIQIRKRYFPSTSCILLITNTHYTATAWVTQTSFICQVYPTLFDQTYPKVEKWPILRIDTRTTYKDQRTGDPSTLNVPYLSIWINAKSDKPTNKSRSRDTHTLL